MYPSKAVRDTSQVIQIGPGTKVRQVHRLLQVPCFVTQRTSGVGSGCRRRTAFTSGLSRVHAGSGETFVSESAADTAVDHHHGPAYI